jgi:hypothetical protein
MSLYDPLLARDVDGIRSALSDFRATHSSDDLFLTVARFAILAYSPSLHGKHAVLSCLAAFDLREELADRFDEVLVECAIYAALARQPWSEPPILEPPASSPEQRTDADELRAAVREHDRLRAERWLAARLDDERLSRDYFRVACDDFGDLGHTLIMAVAAWRLSTVLGERGRFAALRVGVWEMVASGSDVYRERGEAVDFQPLIDALVDRTVAEHGSLFAIHNLFLLDAACEAASIANDLGIASRVRDFLTGEVQHDHGRSSHARRAATRTADVTLYPLGRDCGACLIAHAVAERLSERFPGVDVAPMLAAAHENLDTAPSLEEWN